MWENIVERGRLQVVIWRMRIACLIPNATNTRSEYVVIIAVPLQHWLHERASTLRYTYKMRIIFNCVELKPASRKSRQYGAEPKANFIQTHSRQYKAFQQEIRAVCCLSAVYHRSCKLLWFFPYSCSGIALELSAVLIFFVIYPVVSLTTGPQPLPKPVLYTVRSSASSFNLQ